MAFDTIESFIILTGEIRPQLLDVSWDVDSNIPHLWIFDKILDFSVPTNPMFSSFFSSFFLSRTNYHLSIVKIELTENKLTVPNKLTALTL